MCVGDCCKGMDKIDALLSMISIIPPHPIFFIFYCFVCIFRLIMSIFKMLYVCNPEICWRPKGHSLLCWNSLYESIPCGILDLISKQVLFEFEYQMIIVIVLCMMADLKYFFFFLWNVWRSAVMLENTLLNCDLIMLIFCDICFIYCVIFDSILKLLFILENDDFIYFHFFPPQWKKKQHLNQFWVFCKDI
jgi:hypothetical protein